MKDETVALIPGSLQIRAQPQQCAVVEAFPTVLPIDLSTLLEHATFGNSNVLAADMLLLRSLHNLRQANLESTRDDILHPPVHTTNKITNSQNFTDSNLTKVQFLFKQGPGCWKCLQRLQNSTHHCTAHCTRKCKTWCSGRFRSWHLIALSTLSSLAVFVLWLTYWHRFEIHVRVKCQAQILRSVQPSRTSHRWSPQRPEKRI